MKPNLKELRRLECILNCIAYDLNVAAQHLSNVHERMGIASLTLLLMEQNADTTVEPEPVVLNEVEQYHRREAQKHAEAVRQRQLPGGYDREPEPVVLNEVEQYHMREAQKRKGD